MTLEELEQSHETFISPKTAASVTGESENQIRYFIQDRWKKADGDPDKVRQMVGYSAKMSGNKVLIWRKSYINYVKRMECEDDESQKDVGDLSYEALELIVRGLKKLMQTIG